MALCSGGCARPGGAFAHVRLLLRTSTPRCTNGLRRACTVHRRSSSVKQQCHLICNRFPAIPGVAWFASVTVLLRSLLMSTAFCSAHCMRSCKSSRALAANRLSRTKSGCCCYHCACTTGCRLPNVPPNLCYAVHRLGHASARCVAYLHVRLVGVVSRQLQSLNTGSPKLHAACANSV